MVLSQPLIHSYSLGLSFFLIHSALMVLSQPLIHSVTMVLSPRMVVCPVYRAGLCAALLRLAEIRTEDSTGETIGRLDTAGGQDKALYISDAANMRPSAMDRAQ